MTYEDDQCLYNVRMKLHILILMHNTILDVNWWYILITTSIESINIHHNLSKDETLLTIQLLILESYEYLDYLANYGDMKSSFLRINLKFPF